jgi:hypothetical protein
MTNWPDSDFARTNVSLRKEKKYIPSAAAVVATPSTISTISSTSTKISCRMMHFPGVLSRVRVGLGTAQTQDQNPENMINMFRNTVRP